MGYQNLAFLSSQAIFFTTFVENCGLVEILWTAT